MTNTAAQQRRLTKTPRRLRVALSKKLRSLGGSRVYWQDPEPHAEQLLERGQLFSLPIRLCPGERHMCHRNAADLWARTFNDVQLVTGYARDVKVWIQHSWVLDGATLCETTRCFGDYFGVILTPFEAHKHLFANLLLHYRDVQQQFTVLSEQYPRLFQATLRMSQFLNSNDCGSDLEELFNRAIEMSAPHDAPGLSCR